MNSKVVDTTFICEGRGVIVIGGFDPSTKAGVIRDCLVIHAAGAETISIITCMTFQNDRKVLGVKWVDQKIIENQLMPYDLRTFSWAKVGVLKSIDMGFFVFSHLKKHGVNVIWDPVFTASSGFAFFRPSQIHNIHSLLHMVDIVTPNLDECKLIFGTSDAPQVRTILSKDLPTLTVILKSGHSHESTIRDQVITANGVSSFISERVDGSAHGTGCVFASAIAAFVSRGFSLTKAVRFAQRSVIKHIIHNRHSTHHS